jgi:predicted transcriptional regulator
MYRLNLDRVDERADLAEARRKQAVTLYNQGYRQVEIADFLGITQARVSQIMSRINKATKRRSLRMQHAGSARAAA